MTDGLEDIRLFWSEATELFCVLDEEGRFRSVNPAWTRVLGWTPEELLGRRASDLLAPGETSVLTDAERRPDGTVEVRDVERRHRHRDGSIRWLRWTGYEHGARWLGTARDVTPSRTLDLALRISERRARAMLEAMEDGFVIADQHGRILEVNERFAALTGREASRLVGSVPPYPWWPAELRDELMTQLGAALQGELPGLESVVERPDGHRTAVLVTLEQLRDDRSREPRLLGVIRDISELTMLRDRLIRAHRMARLAAWEWHAADDRVLIVADGVLPDRPPMRESTWEQEREMLSPDDAAKLHARFDDVMAGRREAFVIDVVLRPPQTEPLPVEIWGEPIATPDGRITGVQGVTQLAGAAQLAAGRVHHASG